MSNDERSLVPDGTSPLAQVGKSSRLIGRGIDRLTLTEFRFAELPAGPGVMCRACAVNNRGQVAGFVRWTDERTQAVVWDHGRMTPLATDPNMNSRAFDISDSGHVVGVEYLEEVDASEPEWFSQSTAVIWVNGRKLLLGEPHEKSNSQAHSINEIGQVVGAMHDSRMWQFGEVRAVIWHNGHRKELPTLPREVFDIGGEVPDGTLAGPHDGALAINNHGTIVGHSVGLPVVWEGNDVRELDVPECGYFPSAHDARGVNDHGQIVGTVWPNGYEPPDWTGPPQAVLWDKGCGLIIGPIDYLAEEPNVMPKVTYPRINNRGQVVGVRSTANPNAGCLWESGRIVELATPSEGVTYATDINDLGQIVGCYERRDGVWRACKWG